jgi:hypothetical protein
MARCIPLEVRSFLLIQHLSPNLARSLFDLGDWLLTLEIRAGTFGGMIKGMFGFGGKKSGGGKEEL